LLRAIEPKRRKIALEMRDLEKERKRERDPISGAISIDLDLEIAERATAANVTFDGGIYHRHWRVTAA